jgi:glycosyltransferase involved in cell wall biosynthesis
MRSDTWIVMPAYNAAKTLHATFYDLPNELRSRVILVDDCSTDETLQVAKELGIYTIAHSKNMGYGGNQISCYKAALELGAQVVIMVHPDHQYDARVVGIMSDLIELGNCDIVLGNRIRTRREALSGGMPKWRYFLNRSSTFVENLLLGQTIGDFHSGLRAYSRDVLETVPFERNSNGFTFDQEFLVQSIHFQFRIADIPIPAKYEKDSSSISPLNSLIYGFGGVRAIFFYFLAKLRLYKPAMFRMSSIKVVEVDQ